VETSSIPDQPTLEEIERLYSLLNPEERTELLECLLIAAASGPGQMELALQPWLLLAAASELLGDDGATNTSCA